MELMNLVHKDESTSSNRVYFMFYNKLEMDIQRCNKEISQFQFVCIHHMTQLGRKMSLCNLAE